MSTKQSRFEKNSYFMNLALMQAKKNLGNTKENPSVGCAIVKKNNIISLGHTGNNGRPHAEINTINASIKNLKGSSLYVTLEPCSHYGQTPPCVNTIIKKKIKNVFYSIKDPDPRSYNKCKKILNGKSIAVFNNISYLNAKQFYKSYIISKSKRLPFVTGKLAVSKDYYTKSKKNKWITNFYSRGRSHLFRSQHDCIISSINTIRDDNPLLTCRIMGLEKKTPSRIILDKSLKIPANSKVLKFAKNYKTYIFFSTGSKKKINMLKKLKINLYKIPLSPEGNLDLKETLIKAKSLGFYRIFLECGVKLISNFLKQKLVNEFHLFVSNKNLGINGKNSFRSSFKKFLYQKKPKNQKVYLFGDKLISYNIK